MKKFLWLLVLFIPTSLYAATIFTPTPDDKSIIYLGYLFGNVEGVLPFAGASILKGILVSFNNAVLALGGIIVTYSLVVGTVHTAHQGEALGKEWNSVWIPMRAAFGFALLVPVQVKSYALIQVFVMWVIVQGVGAADYVWAQGLDLMRSGVVPTGVPTQPATPNTSGAYQAASQVFVSEVCAQLMAGVSKTSTRYLRQDNKINFGVQGLKPIDMCGSISYNSATSPQGTAINQAIDQMVTQVDSVAASFVTYSLMMPNIPTAQQAAFEKAIMKIAEQYNSAVTNAYYATGPNGPGTNAEMEEYANVFNSAKEAGWIYAGNYFLALSKISNNFTMETVKGPDTQQFNASALSSQLSRDDTSFVGTRLKSAELMVHQEAASITSPTDFSKFFSDNLSVIAKGFLNFLNTLTNWVTGSGGGSPILAIQQFGYWVYSIIITLWGVFTVLVFTTALILYGASNQIFVEFFGGGGMGEAFSMAFNVIFTPAMFAAGILLVSGISMAYYTPMIPYLVYTLAALGWLILVIETMVAAPILALGILHPEGQHTVFGHGQAGIMLLAGVFLRPSLMIVGFFAAMLMSYLAIAMVCAGFTPMAAATLGDLNTGWGTLANVTTLGVTSLVGMIAMMVIFTTLVFSVLNRSFSLIYVIPDRIMRWLGQGPEQTAGIEQEIGQAESAVHKGGEQAEQTGGKMGQRQMEIGQAGQRARDRAKDKKDAEAGETTGVSTGKGSGGPV